MNVARKWIFPIIRIIVFAAIAIALVKIAFFADTSQASGPDSPTGAIIEPQVPVMLGTVYNDVSVQGTVTADAARPIQATLAGEIIELHTRQGKSVKKGAKILTIRAEVFGNLVTTETPGVTYKYVTVTAPASGVVSNLAVIVGQMVAVGDAVGQVAPPTFTVSGALSPDQLYRLLNEPKEATVTVFGGPAPFTCSGLTISTALAGSDPGEGGDGGTSVKCSVPRNVTVFNGLQAEISIPGGIAENVLVVPVTAVEGIAEFGNVYVVLADGTSELRPVVLGLNDGINVEVIEGLTEGELILQFVPGAPEMPGEPGIPGEECYDNGNGEIVCEDWVK